MNVQVTVRVTFSASTPLLPPSMPMIPTTPSSSPAPWLCAGNERSRHAWSGLRLGKAGRQSEVKQGEAALAWTHTPLWACDGHQKTQADFLEKCLRVTNRERNQEIEGIIIEVLLSAGLLCTDAQVIFFKTNKMYQKSSFYAQYEFCWNNVWISYADKTQCNSGKIILRCIYPLIRFVYLHEN